MNTIGQALVTKLLSVSSIYSYVGGPPARIYPIHIKQGSAYPAMVYHTIIKDKMTVLTGGINVYDVRMMLGVWDADITRARAVLEEAAKALVPPNQVATNGWTQTWGDMPVSPYGFNYADEIHDHLPKAYLAAAHVLFFCQQPTS